MKATAGETAAIKPANGRSAIRFHKSTAPSPVASFAPSRLAKVDEHEEIVNRTTIPSLNEEESDEEGTSEDERSGSGDEITDDKKLSKKKGFKNESAEEKRARKNKVKEEKRLRRLEKKANKQIFRADEVRTSSASQGVSCSVYKY